jgi:hypothetical protein
MTTTNLTARDINIAKENSQYRRAGQLAALLGHNADYGCHFGMRSTREAARYQFQLGHDEVTLLAARNLFDVEVA